MEKWLNESICISKVLLRFNYSQVVYQHSLREFLRRARNSCDLIKNQISFITNFIMNCVIRYLIASAKPLGTFLRNKNEINSKSWFSIVSSRYLGFQFDTECRYLFRSVLNAYLVIDRLHYSRNKMLEYKGIHQTILRHLRRNAGASSLLNL